MFYEEPLSRFGTLLRQARLQLGQTEEEAAIALNISVAEVQAIEAGRRYLPKNFVKRIHLRR